MQRPFNAYINNLKHEQDELALQYIPALRAMAFRLKERLPASVDVNDLISIATEELIKLARKYDKEQNTNFWGYAKKRVNGAMLDYLRSLDTMSRQNRKIIKDIQIVVDEYINEFDEEPSDEFIAQKLEIEVEKIKEARLSYHIDTLMPLDDRLSDYSNEDENVIEKLDKQIMLEKITSYLEKLDKREQMIIQLYFFEELSLKEISEILNISQSRICQIQSRILNALKKELSNG
ncbi:RNA polymerase sigma factor FliA [Campylobacter canadensis]|uniref:RNA polymerase sigma factor FliA n=1 Tax=Campylobacter canadensis TaxID=449520 RepID=A0ABS7WTG6_9BACT|nr:RNA polymerase sigma factor FliA [Campylobacter canadensis]MBZ7988052.1 RNA polymerase sigma factor FliA [Campylobacter canadensis]MBZ7995485.1 RNA polymerase sigma factor FliA [Campylobacter canadensis]MBZ7997297.1 RNA polymerase sigma factor FliA [Campylobacter canadensis]MBZ7999015.1 RNA polymerase sigma factor FliA [Campylobacter canadensis]MBZ8000825.1 RNA polymerase sigma factor FliA [Campylobacter canadensis]